MVSNIPTNFKSWYTNLDELSVFFKYPEEIRKIIYTTNAIESLNNQLRKVTKNKRSFPSDDAVFKSLCLAIGYISKKLMFYNITNHYKPHCQLKNILNIIYYLFFLR